MTGHSTQAAKWAMRTTLLTSATFLALPSLAHAQVTEDEIIVTATKRAESIQDVGLSISAISGVDLQERGAVDFEDYAISIPNLAFGATDDGVLANRTISIRGIEGLNTTGFYIDDIPLDESISPLVLDVERVEVLRGPQGTLYGARGLGGTVRVITKKPDFTENAGRIHTGLSTTKEGGLNYVVDGAYNFALSDTFAARVTGYLQEESGIFDRIVGPATNPGNPAAAGAAGAISSGQTAEIENVDDKTTYGGQIALRFAPSDQLDINAKVLGQRTELDGFPLADFVFDPASPPNPFDLAADDFTQNRLFNVAENGTDEWYQFSLSINYETDYGTFTSSTGWLDRETQEQEDSSEFISFTLLRDFIGLAPAAIPSPISQRLDFETFVQEGRFVSDFEGPFQITVGGFYQDTNDNEAFQPENIATGFDAEFSTQLSGGVPASGFTGTGDLIFTSETVFEVEEFGIYAEASYDLTERLTATVGARYFDVSTNFTDMQSGFAVGGLNAVNVGPLTSSEDGFNFKGLLEYEASETTNVYASATEGFRIGGANGALPAALGCPAQAQALGVDPADAVTFGSDNLWSYELGTKSSWNGGRATLNAAAFYIDFQDIQQRVLLACGFDFVANIGAARSLGFELEGSIRPTDDLILQAAVGYTDAEFTESVPGLVDEGARLQQIPRLTASGSFEYTLPISGWNGSDTFLRGDIAHVGSSISRTVDSNNPRTRPSYTLANARLGLKAEDWQAAFYIDNLFNEDAVLGDNRTLAAEAAGRPRIVRSRPRAIGVEFRKNF